MTNGKIIYTSLPDQIKGFLLITNGWLVGGAITDLLEGRVPKDYDILIPDRSAFQDTVKTFENYDMTCNSFGGMKIQYQGVEIDFWCEELSHFLLFANKVGHIFNMKRNILMSVGC